MIAEIKILYPGLTKQRGRIINYIGMTFDYSKHDCVRITIANYKNEVLEGCTDMSGKSQTPALSNLFDIRPVEASPLLTDEDKERLHSVIAQIIYLAKRVRPDLLVAVAFLTKQVSAPQKDDQGKLVRAIQYLRETAHMGIVLEGQQNLSILAYVDASYGVHKDLKSHTGCVVETGRGLVYSKSTGQKLNMKSSTAAELAAFSDFTSQIIWT